MVASEFAAAAALAAADAPPPFSGPRENIQFCSGMNKNVKPEKNFH